MTYSNDGFFSVECGAATFTNIHLETLQTVKGNAYLQFDKFESFSDDCKIEGYEIHEKVGDDFIKSSNFEEYEVHHDQIRFKVKENKNLPETTYKVKIINSAGIEAFSQEAAYKIEE